MKQQFKQLMSLVALSVVLVACSKTIPELSGTASEADFSFAQLPASDTLPYAYRVQFTNLSKEEFLYQWDFGDNSSLSSAKDPLHTYRVGGTYDVRLTTVGTNGNNSVTKKVFVADACGNSFFRALTNCGSAEWTWSLDGDAIRVLSADATQVFFAGAAAGCQADDVYKFGADGSFAYDANGQTFDVQSGYSCQGPKANANTYRVVARTGQRPQILLGNTVGGSSRPFIGTTDEVRGNAYTVMSFTNETMVLRSTLAGGELLEVKLRRKVALTIADIRQLLTGANGKAWRFDASPGANAIIVGTEANPAQFFGGGALADCQIDDVYTFTPANALSYNANGATFNGGNIAPNFNCGIDRSYNTSFTFGPTTGGVAGLATIQLPGTVLPNFIGTTDVPENVYRIIEITPTRMTLRAGTGAGTVFQFKLVSQ
ncbi:MAG: PKD domain-containing protein [Chitinophagaceae bacterium]|nr:PKD domain-containing protein [Chitinophagaceae bacterium]